MKAFLSIKFHEDAKNKKVIEDLAKSIEAAGINLTILTRDYENWGKTKFEPKNLMELTFKLIKESDLLIIELSEKGVGLGIEAGFAYANNIPVIVIAKKGSDISSTLQGIAKKVIFYDKAEELEERFKENLRKL